jgi:hypothetical protein
MAWNNLVNPRAITSRRRGIATALVYGLSLTVRFSSGAGEDTEAQAQAAQGTNPMTSVMINDGAQIFGPPRSAQPVFFRSGWTLGSGACRAACEGSGPMPPILNCSSNP